MDAYPTFKVSSFQEVAGADIEALKSRLLFSTRSPGKTWPYLVGIPLGLFSLLVLGGLVLEIFRGQFQWQGLVGLLILLGLFGKVLDVSTRYDVDVYKTGLAFREHTWFGLNKGPWIGVPYDQLLFLDLRGRKIAVVYLSERRVELAKGMTKEAMRRFGDMLTSYQRRGDLPQALEVKM